MNEFQTIATAALACVNVLLVWIMSDIRDRVKRVEDALMAGHFGERRTLERG